jgi:hypothetical protein
MYLKLIKLPLPLSLHRNTTNLLDFNLPYELSKAKKLKECNASHHNFIGSISLSYYFWKYIWNGYPSTPLHPHANGVTGVIAKHTVGACYIQHISVSMITC